MEIYTNHIILLTNWIFKSGLTDLNRNLYRRTNYYHHHHRHTYKKQNHGFNIQLPDLDLRQTSPVVRHQQTHNTHTAEATKTTHNHLRASNKLTPHPEFSMEVASKQFVQEKKMCLRSINPVLTCTQHVTNTHNVHLTQNTPLYS